MPTAFETTCTIRLGHTDAAGRLFFARQLDLVHEAYEDWLAHEGTPIRTLIEDPTGGLPIVAAESAYTGQLFAGDVVTIRLSIEACSTRSFTLAYALLRGETPVGTAKTVHVAVDAATGKSRPLSEALTRMLKRHLPDG
ncbi:MAG: thioesterase family protein [Myxococcota bacterium]